MVPLGAYLIYGSAFECTWMVKQSRFGAITAPALIGCGGVMAAASVPVYWQLLAHWQVIDPYPENCLLGELGWPLAASAIALVGCFAWFMPKYEANSGFLFRAILAGWISVYFGVCFAFAIAIRLTGTPAWGLYLLVGMIVVTKFSDTGAYFTGRAIGKTKLCPNVSPGKTIEGLIGGAVTATFAGWIYFGVCAPRVFSTDAIDVSLQGLVVLGTSLTIAGVFGDLLESIFKREMGCKDSGKLLPGLGGLWDVTDSLLPASVVGYLVVVAELIKGPGQ